MSLSPVVTSTALSENKVIGSENLSERSGPHAVHGAGLQVDKDGAGHVLATAGLVVVHVDALQLEVAVAMVGAGGVDTVLVRDNLPELNRKRGYEAFLLIV